MKGTYKQEGNNKCKPEQLENRYQRRYLLLTTSTNSYSKKKTNLQIIFFFFYRHNILKQLNNTIQKMIVNRVITYGANASHGNPNPVKHIHDFLQVKMRKYGENSKSTSRDWLNNRHLQREYTINN